MESDFKDINSKTRYLLLFRRQRSCQKITKGVAGGFRPIVKWREISIHRRREAGRRIMTCILSAATILIILGLCLLLLGLFVLGGQCPFHWLDLRDRCLYVSNHNFTWVSVRNFCADQGGNMIDIASQSENNDIAEKLTGPTWIGLLRLRSRSQFEWTSGQRLVFHNWRTSPSVDSDDVTQCAMMDDEDGNWEALIDCNLQLHAACEYGKTYYPPVLVGPVVMVCGLIVAVLSVEVWKRQRDTIRKSRGLPDEEELPEAEEVFQKEIPAVVRPRPLTPLVPEESPVRLTKSSSNPSCVRSFSVRREGRKQSPSVAQEQLELVLTPKNLS